MNTVNTQEIYKNLVEQGFQDYANAADANKPAVLQDLFSKMETLGVVNSIQDAATELPKLAAELSQFVSKQSAEASKTAQTQEQGMIASIMQMDQGFVKDTLDGSFGIVGFANSVITFMQTAVTLFGGDPKMFDGAREALYEVRDELRQDMQNVKSDVDVDISATLDRFEQNFQRAIDDAMQNAPAVFNKLGQNFKSTVSASGASYSGSQVPVGSPNEVTLQEFTNVVENSGLTPQLQQGLVTAATMAAQMNPNGNVGSLDQNELSALKNHASFEALNNTQQTNINPKLELALNN